LRGRSALATPLAVTIQQAQNLTGESRSSVYNHIASGEYVAKKSGARVLILYDTIKRRIEGLPRAEVKPPRPRAPFGSALVLAASVRGGVRIRPSPEALITS